MHKLWKIKIIITLLMSMLACMNSVSAAECEDKSPNYIELGDEYFNLDKSRSLTASENEQLQALFERMEGNWKGQIVSTDCMLGIGTSPSKVQKSASLSAEMKLYSDGNLRIAADIVSSQDNTSRQSVLSIIHDIPIFEFEFKSPNHVVFSSRRHKSNSPLRETIFEIRLQGNTLVLATYFYASGVYAGEEVWTMSPD